MRNPETGQLEPADWEYALEVAAAAVEQAGSSVAAIVGGTTTNEEGFLLQRLLRAVGSADLDSRAGLPPVPAETQQALAAPGLQATIPDIEFAHTVLLLGTDPIDDVASLDLRIRKGVRRNGVKLAVATSRPSALDANARLWLRYAPGAEHAFVAALAAAVTGADGIEALCEKADADPKAVAALAQLLTEGGEDVVIVWGQRIGAAPLPSLLNLAAALRVGERPGAGLIEVPVGGNGRGLREVGVQSNAGPGLQDAKAGKSAREIARAGCRRRPDYALPAARRPGPRLRRSPAVGARAGGRGGGRRARDAAERRAARHRDRRLPGRVVRREGGHDRQPRRPRPASPSGDRPPRRGPRRVAGARRRRQARRPRPAGADRPDGHQRRSSPPSRSMPA